MRRELKIIKILSLINEIENQKNKKEGRGNFYRVGKVSSLRIFCRLGAVAKMRNVLAYM